MSQKETPLYLQFYRSILQLKSLARKLPPPAALGLSHLEFMTLHILQDYQTDHPDLPGIQVSVLSELLHQSRSAMSQHINAMEKKDLVQRIPSKTDRRVTYLSPTAHAAEILEQNAQEHLLHLEKFCSQFGAEDMQEAIRLIEKSYRILSKQLPCASPFHPKEN